MLACIRTHRPTPGYILAEVHPAANNCMCGDDGNARALVPMTARLESPSSHEKVVVVIVVFVAVAIVAIVAAALTVAIAGIAMFIAV